MKKIKKQSLDLVKENYWHKNVFDNLYYLFDSLRQKDKSYKDFSIREQREIDFYIGLINKKFDRDIKLLEIGVGYGRLAKKFKENKHKFNHSVEFHGLDLSDTMLALASGNVDEDKLYKGHMKDASKICYAHSFDAVVIAFTTFGYYQDETDNLETLKAIQQVLVEIGVVVIEQYPPVAEYKSLNNWSRSMTYKEYNELMGIDTDVLDGNMYHLDKTSELVPVNEYVTMYRGDCFYYKFNSNKKYLFRRNSYDIHLYTPKWFEENFKKIGFKNIEFHKDWQHGACLTNDDMLNSNVMICVAEKS